MGNLLVKLVRRLFAKKEMKLLMVGLPGSGKNTILTTLDLGKPRPDNIQGIDVKIVEYRDVSIKAFNVGESITGPQWKELLKGAQGLVFVVDSKAEDKIQEAKRVLKQMLEQEELRDATLLVLANKKDVAGAMDAYQIAEKLELKSLGRGRRWYIQSSNAITGLGIYEGLDWLSNNISSKA